MNNDEGTIIQTAFNHGLPCDLPVSSYNEAVSLQAKLRRYIRAMNEVYAGREGNKFEGFDVLLLKPRTLRFDYPGKLQMRPVKEVGGVHDLIDRMDAESKTE